MAIISENKFENRLLGRNKILCKRKPFCVQKGFLFVKSIFFLFYSISHFKILYLSTLPDWSKLRAFAVADDKTKLAKMFFCTTLENKNFSHRVPFIMSSTNVFNSDNSKILSFTNCIKILLPEHGFNVYFKR